MTTPAADKPVQTDALDMQIESWVIRATDAMQKSRMRVLHTSLLFPTQEMQREFAVRMAQNKSLNVVATGVKKNAPFLTYVLAYKPEARDSVFFTKLETMHMTEAMFVDEIDTAVAGMRQDATSLLNIKLEFKDDATAGQFLLVLRKKYKDRLMINGPLKPARVWCVSISNEYSFARATSSGAHSIG